MNNETSFPKKINVSLMGTPKTLEEAIELALCVGPMTEVKERLYNILRDFIAQKFQVAVLTSADSDLLEDQLLKIYAQLTKRKE